MGKQIQQNFPGHLKEFRSLLIWILIVLAISTLLAFFFARELMDFLLVPYKNIIAREVQGSQPMLMTIFPAEAFLLSFKVAFVSGLLFSLPILFFKIWHFIAPGLHLKEKKLLFSVFSAGTLLFLVGSLFAYYLVVPEALHFFWRYGSNLDLIASWTISYYLNFVLMFLFAFGAAFELPLVIILLSFFGLVSPYSLASKRPYVILAVAIFAALLTPPDVISQVMLAVPVWFLFEISLLIARVFTKGSSRK